MNKICLVGRLTRDPEIRYASDNQLAVTRFSVAVDRTFKREGQQTADFIPIVTFGKLAENCHKYLGKGRLVSVAGRLQSRSWDDKEGNRRFALEVIADEVNFLTKPKDSQVENQGNDDCYDSDFHPVEDDLDDLPF